MSVSQEERVLRFVLSVIDESLDDQNLRLLFRRFRLLRGDRRCTPADDYGLLDLIDMLIDVQSIGGESLAVTFEQN